MRKRRLFSALIFAIPVVLAVATIAVADEGRRNFGSAPMKRVLGSLADLDGGNRDV